MSEPTTPAASPSDGTMSLAEAAQLRFLEPDKLHFERFGARVRLTITDEICYVRVAILRAFPLSRPQSYFSVRDGAGKEIGLLRDLNDLDADSRRLVEEELARRYLVAVIRRIVSVTERFGTVDWVVETDRGESRFTTRELRENAIRFGPFHFLLSDVENNRYEVPDLNLLDARSQSLLLRHL